MNINIDTSNSLEINVKKFKSSIIKTKINKHKKGQGQGNNLNPIYIQNSLNSLSINHLSLLQFFDCIYIYTDNSDEKKDKKLSDRIFQNQFQIDDKKNPNVITNNFSQNDSIQHISKNTGLSKEEIGQLDLLDFHNLYKLELKEGLKIMSDNGIFADMHLHNKSFILKYVLYANEFVKPKITSVELVNYINDFVKHLMELFKGYTLNSIFDLNKRIIGMLIK